jgi:prevent-host-death family protein
MSKTISVEELPRKAERLLRTAWEGHESVVLERNGEPVAAVVPMDEYRRWHSDIQKADGKEPKSKKTAEPPESSLAYELPPDLLAEYHRLLDKKFSEGLTPAEEAELERVGKELDEADMNTPLGQAILTQAQEQHEQWMRRMDKVMETLRTLKESS